MGRMKEKGRWKRSEERAKEAFRQISIGSAAGSRGGNSDHLNLNRMNIKTAGNNSTRSNYSMRHIVFRDEESKMRTCTNQATSPVAPAFITQSRQNRDFEGRTQSE